ncbi:MAG: hypothetical protein JWM07_391 [Candidatus Saccharibacteria bacterium]|nr:hypothetical protein [Candidatus Saccharibacteria bacterium]
MSLIKEKAREIARKGEASRGDFTPQGVPLRVYRWWRRHAKRPAEKVGLCSFFWIVALWAPLLFVRQAVAKVFSDRQFWLCMLLACGAIIIGVGIRYPGQVGIVLVGFLACGVALVGFFAGIVFADYLVDKNGYDDTPKLWKVVTTLLIVVTAPIAAAGFVLYQIIHVFRSKFARRFYSWTWNARLVKGHVSPLLASVLLGFCAMTYVSVMGGWWMVSLVIASLVILFFVGRWGIEKLGFYLSKRRDERNAYAAQVARQRNIGILEPVLRVIFNHLHLESSDDDEVYWRWYQRYIVRVEQGSSPAVWGTIYGYASPYYFPDWCDWNAEMLNAVSKELDTVRVAHIQAQNLAEERRQLVVRKVTLPFTVMADFIILFAQFIYAVKKRFCPYVKLPQES